MRFHRTAIAAAAAATLAATAAPAAAQEPEGIAEFDSQTAGLTVQAPDELATLPAKVPDREDFAFLGDPGDLVWVAGSPDGSAFPTIDATGVDGDLTVRLDKAEGPGDAWLYTFDGPGLAEPLASTAGDDTFEVHAGTATVVVLAVDEPGQYTLELGGRESDGGHGFAPTTGHAQAADATAVATYQVTAADVTAEEVTETLADDSGDSIGGAQTDTSCEVIDSGHIDIGPRFVDGEWTAQLRDDRESESVWRELGDTVLHVPDAALAPIPEGDFGFLGQAGDEVYMLPQTQIADVVWPGWNTQDSKVIDGVPGAIDWNLTEVDGPGQFALFLTGTFGGADILFDTAEGLPQTVSIPHNTHAHGNWTFSEPGVYLLTVEFAGTTGDGEEVADTGVIQVAVGDQTDPGDACLAGSGGGGSSDDDDDGDEGGFLPTTGAGWLAFAGIIAAALLLVGGLIMFLSRKRKRGPTDAN